MYLYEVIRWGNDAPDDDPTGGPDGPDTCFLVRAGSLEEAAALVDVVLKRLPQQNKRVSRYARALYLLGTDSGSSTEARVLRGPYIQSAYNYGWQIWHRDDPDGTWEEQ